MDWRVDVKIKHPLTWVTMLCLVAGCGGTSDTSMAHSSDDGVDDPAPAEPGSPGGADTSGGTDPADDGPVAMDPDSMDPDSMGRDDDPSVDDEPLDPTGGAALPLRLDAVPENFRHIRLTHQQWENSVRDNLRLDGPTEWLDRLAPDVAPSTYSNNEERLYVGKPLVVDYATAAEALALRIAEDPDSLAAVYSGSDAAEFVQRVGRRFYRRPLTAQELATFGAIFEAGAALPSAPDAFSGGAGLVLEVLLQSPRFLYRIEAGEVDSRLDGYELATKLAYFVTNTTPTDELLDVAAAGGLDTDAGLRSAAERLLASPAAKSSLLRFHSETFHFSRYRDIAKDSSQVLGFDPVDNADLEQAAERFFDHLFQEGLGVRDIFTSEFAFANDTMAALYDVPGPGSEELAMIDLPAGRQGFFTQLPFLTLDSNNLTPNPIARGVQLNYDVLCAEVPNEIALPNVQEAMGETNRERVESLTEPTNCGTCHQLYINPLGFAFENFDGFGRVRELDNGQPVDTVASYPFEEGQLEFSGAGELMQLVAESQQAHRCYAAHLSAYGLAHDLGVDDAALVDTLTSRSQGDSSSLSELVLELVTSSAFHTRRGSP